MCQYWTLFALCVSQQFQVAPLLFALVDVDSSYWAMMFLVMMFVGE
jgi:hypothetical protein